MALNVTGAAVLVSSITGIICPNWEERLKLLATAASECLTIRRLERPSFGILRCATLFAHILWRHKFFCCAHVRHHQRAIAWLEPIEIFQTANREASFMRIERNSLKEAEWLGSSSYGRYIVWSIVYGVSLFWSILNPANVNGIYLSPLVSNSTFVLLQISRNFPEPRAICHPRKTRWYRQVHRYRWMKNIVTGRSFLETDLSFRQGAYGVWCPLNHLHLWVRIMGGATRNILLDWVRNRVQGSWWIHDARAALSIEGKPVLQLMTRLQIQKSPKVQAKGMRKMPVVFVYDFLQAFLATPRLYRQDDTYYHLTLVFCAGLLLEF